jgi:hypothetical protein
MQTAAAGISRKWNLVVGFAVALVAVIAATAGSGVVAASQARDAVVKLVMQVERADYEGDRPALRRLYGELAPFAEDKEIGARVQYWRGFALWRRAINGFNETVDPKESAADVADATEAFRSSFAKDPTFVDAKVGAVACLGLSMWLNMKDPERMQEFGAQASPLLKEAREADPDNPRLLWVLGPILWQSPPERGGGQDKAIAAYDKGLEIIRKQKKPSDPLEPSWGEPELLMSLAWSYLNKTKPDLDAAERNARAALELVPYWHYTRDILMAKIREAKAKGETKQG